MIARFAALAPHILGIMRILAGIMFASHGAQKMFGWFGGMPPEAPRWIVWSAGPMELFGGVLIALGLLTRPVAFLCSGLMAVAYFKGHAMAGGLLPKVNGGELAMFYCWLFLYISAAGGGKFALDNLFTRGRSSAPLPQGS